MAAALSRQAHAFLKTVHFGRATLSITHLVSACASGNGRDGGYPRAAGPPEPTRATYKSLSAARLKTNGGHIWIDVTGNRPWTSLCSKNCSTFYHPTRPSLLAGKERRSDPVQERHHWRSEDPQSRSVEEGWFRCVGAGEVRAIAPTLVLFLVVHVDEEFHLVAATEFDTRSFARSSSDSGTWYTHTVRSPISEAVLLLPVISTISLPAKNLKCCGRSSRTPEAVIRGGRTGPDKTLRGPANIQIITAASPHPGIALFRDGLFH